jgi:hypothetical protein
MGLRLEIIGSLPSVICRLKPGANRAVLALWRGRMAQHKPQVIIAACKIFSTLRE